jgi:hypothetical protein
MDPIEAQSKEKVPQPRKLVVARETLRMLGPNAMQRVAGGTGATGHATCHDWGTCEASEATCEGCTLWCGSGAGGCGTQASCTVCDGTYADCDATGSCTCGCPTGFTVCGCATEGATCGYTCDNNC